MAIETGDTVAVKGYTGEHEVLAVSGTGHVWIRISGQSEARPISYHPDSLVLIRKAKECK